jgi:biopolymer transport protein TolQ
METVVETVAPIAHDMSMFGLFMQADWVVKSIMIGLLLLSIACKDRPRTGLSAVFAAAMEEWTVSHADNAANPAGLQARLRIVLDTTIAVEIERLDRNLALLATTGSAAPFIGLFGTVWGIMNSFTAIAAAESTSLSVVAPGIAEALFATAIGLVAAIPAVIAYNKLSGDSGHIVTRLEAFADRVSVLLSRQLDARPADVRSAA